MADSTVDRQKKAKLPPVTHPCLSSLYSVAVALFIRIDAFIHYYTMPSKSAVESLGALSRCPCVRAMDKVPMSCLRDRQGHELRE